MRKQIIEDIYLDKPKRNELYIILLLGHSISIRNTMESLMNTGRNLSLLYVLLPIVISSTAALIGAGHLRLPEGHVALFVFGDSLYDPGNNNYINTTTNYQANFWPYGETYFHFPTGRFSDGRLMPDFISTALLS